MVRRVLGIDVASAAWSSIGSATIEFDAELRNCVSVVPGAIPWPSTPLTPGALADTIDQFARRHEIGAVALDGPQGWRHPETASGEPGVGRRCEYRCSTQGKTGCYPRTYPGNQRPWIEFSIELFAKLLAKEGVELADAENWELSSDYGVLECFPTSAWRTSGLRPLPGKSKSPPLGAYIESLRRAYQLPAFETRSHDDLQAVVAALTAVGALGGPAVPIPEGQCSAVLSDRQSHRRVEGLIWNVRPLTYAEPCDEPSVEKPPVTSASSSSSGSNGAVYVTQKVLDQVVRAGDTQMQIAVSPKIDGSRHRKVRVSIEAGEDQFELIAGDTHVIWRTHQDGKTMESFERLFAMLSDRPGQPLSVKISEPERTTSAKPSESDVPRRPALVQPRTDWRYVASEVRKAGELLRRNRQEGEARFEEILSDYPDDGMVYLERGRARGATGNKNGAEQDLVKAQRLLPLPKYKELAGQELRRLRGNPATVSGIRDALVVRTPAPDELLRAHELFKIHEKRSGDFDVASRLLDQALTGVHRLSVTVPVAMLLQSWNFAFYQETRSFDASHYARLDAALIASRRYLEMFRARKLLELEMADQAMVLELFNTLGAVVGRVGAAKVLHLWAPDFFPLWDNPIAAAYGYDLSDPARQYWTSCQRSPETA